MTMPTTLECLPTTVLLDILAYLSPIDRYRSMHNINSALDKVIRSSTTYINLSNIESKQDFDYHLEHILPDVINTLCSIKISNDLFFDKERDFIHAKDQLPLIGVIKKVQVKMNFMAYKKLEELTLENVNATQVELIAQKIVSMPQLKYLNISFHGELAEFFTSIYKNTVIRSNLKTLRLILTDAKILSLSNSLIHSFQHLDYLTIDSCRIANIPILIPLIQNIKYLNLCIWDYPYQSETYSTQTLILPNLVYLKLEVDEIRWNYVQHLLKQCGQKLKSLTFTGNVSLDFINAENWKTLITDHLKQLIKFKFYVTIWETPVKYINLEPFNKDFWHNLNVYVACDDIKASLEEDGDVVNIYTVPFCQSSVLTAVSTVKVIPPPMNASFARIKVLKVSMNDQFRNIKRLYENADSVILNSDSGHNRDILLFLNMSLKCNNIHHIGFGSVCAVLKPQIFFQLLQQCPNLYSLRLHSKVLNDMTYNLSDEKTCLLLNKMIKHIQFNGGLEGEDFNEQLTRKFVHTFTNLERIYIHMKSSDDVLKKLSMMVHDMKMLNKIYIKTSRNVPNGLIDQIKESIVDLKDCYIRKEKSCLFIWC